MLLLICGDTGLVMYIINCCMLIGISLNEAQWKTLKEGIDDLDDALNSL